MFRIYENQEMLTSIKWRFLVPNVIQIDEEIWEVRAQINSGS
jgi:hypothetical protein